MTDATGTIQSDIELEAQRATVRRIRAARVEAVGTFVEALGYSREDVRGVQVVGGEIRLHVFVKDSTGAKILFENPSTGKKEAPVTERVLKLSTRELDDEEMIIKFLAGEPLPQQ